MYFAYDDANWEHITKHGVAAADAEYVVEHAKSFLKVEDGKYIVFGKTRSGRLLEVVFAFKTAEDIEPDAMNMEDLAAFASKPNAVAVYLIHAQPTRNRGAKRKHR